MRVDGSDQVPLSSLQDALLFDEAGTPCHELGTLSASTVATKFTSTSPSTSPSTSTSAGLTASRSSGVTLVELMVVVAIIGITLGLSLRTLKGDPAGSSSRKVASLMATAYRLAVAGGAVRPDVATAPLGTRARAKLEITTDGASGFNLVTVWKLVEDPLPATTFQWVNVTGSYLPEEVHVFGVSNAAVLAPTGVAPAALGAGTATELYYPDGTADAFTVYVERRDGSGTRYRVVGLPLAPPPQLFIDW